MITLTRADLPTIDHMRNRGTRVAMVAQTYGFRTVDALFDAVLALALAGGETATSAVALAVTSEPAPARIAFDPLSIGIAEAADRPAVAYDVKAVAGSLPAVGKRPAEVPDPAPAPAPAVKPSQLKGSKTDAPTEESASAESTPRKPRGGRPGTGITKEVLEPLLVGEKLTYVAAAKRLGTTKGTIAGLATRYRIHKRKPAGQTEPAPETVQPLEPAAQQVATVPMSQRIRTLRAEGKSATEVAEILRIKRGYVATIEHQDREAAAKRASRQADGVAPVQPESVSNAEQAVSPSARRALPAAQRDVLEQPAGVPAPASRDGGVRVPAGSAAHPDRRVSAPGLAVGRGGERDASADASPRIGAGTHQARAAGHARFSDDGKPARPLGITPGFRALGPAPRTCQWIDGEPKPDDSCKCGKPAVEGKPYCAEHLARAYVPYVRRAPGSTQ